MAELRNSKKIRALAERLREMCAARDVAMAAAEAEAVLVGSIRGIAARLGVSERTAVDSYLTDQFMATLVDTLVEADREHRQALDCADAMTLSVLDAGTVVAGRGMAMKLAADAIDRAAGTADSLGLATDCADAVVGLGVALAHAGPGGAVEVDGRTLVFSRRVLLRSLQLLRDGTWSCSCSAEHEQDGGCRLQQALIADLRRAGGWDGGPLEPPAADR